MFSLDSPVHQPPIPTGDEGRDALAPDDHDWQWQQPRSHSAADSTAWTIEQQFGIQHLQRPREEDVAIPQLHFIQDQFQPWSPTHPLDGVSSHSSITAVNEDTAQPDLNSCSNVNGVQQSLMYQELAVDSGPPHTSLLYHQQPTANNNNHHIQPILKPPPTAAAIVLGVKDGYILSAMVPNTSMVMIHPPHRVRAVCACIRCRKLKASCDNQRPCSRCVTSGHECIDRSEEEIVKSGIARKKRPPPSSVDSTNSTPPATVPVAAPTSTSVVNPLPALKNGESQDPSSFSTWSRSFLNLLIQSGVRDSILKIQARFDNLPIELPNLLEWHSQVSFLCSHRPISPSPSYFAPFRDLTREGIEPNPGWPIQEGWAIG